MTERDAGMTLALARAGGIKPLARALGLTPRAVKKWRQVPQTRLFAVAAVTGIAASDLRPDLEDWIIAERVRQRQDKARKAFSLVIGSGMADPMPERRGLDEVAIDFLITMQAVRFVAEELSLAPGRIMSGRRREEMGARSWSMALAIVVGRARATAIGAWFGTSRQNVDNAAERYLRARDGDCPEDFIDGEDGAARVLERGRLRPAKTATPDLVEAEARFAARLDQVEPERKRA